MRTSQVLPIVGARTAEHAASAVAAARLRLTAAEVLAVMGPMR